MKQHLFGAALTMAMLGTLAMPATSLAARNIITARQYEQQNLTAISPGDTDAQELLSSLGIELQPSDELWYNADFIALVQKYKELRSQGLDIVGQVGELVLEAFDMTDIGSRIDREEFQAIFAMTPEEKAQQEELKAYIKENLDAFKANPDAFLSEILNNLGTTDNLFPEPYDENAPYAYGYSDPYDAVDTGRIVWLHDGSYNPLDGEMTVTWEQTYGPSVTWLNTTSKNDAAFIMPSLADAEADYIVFTVTADNGVSTSTYDVYVYWLRPYEGEVAEAYREIFGREIDAFHYAYWDELHYQGMSIEQIRQHFELMRDNEA